MIRLFERQMRTEIAVGRVPTIADLRARRLEATRVALEEALRSGDLDEYRLPVESLAEDHDPLRIAMAAVKLVHESSRARHDDAPEQDTSDIPETGKAPARGRGGPASGMGRIWIGAGRRAGIRPQDLVGAIAGESKIRGRDIGAIDIGDTFSVVELPEQLVDRVLEAMQDALIRGRPVPVRRFRD